MLAQDCLTSGTWHSAQRVCSHGPHQWTPGHCNIQSPRFLCRKINALVKVKTGFPGDLDSKESTFNAGELGAISGLGRSPGGGHGSPLQYACLENPHG